MIQRILSWLGFAAPPSDFINVKIDRGQLEKYAKFGDYSIYKFPVETRVEVVHKSNPDKTFEFTGFNLFSKEQADLISTDAIGIRPLHVTDEQIINALSKWPHYNLDFGFGARLAEVQEQLLVPIYIKECNRSLKLASITHGNP